MCDRENALILPILGVGSIQYIYIVQLRSLVKDRLTPLEKLCDSSPSYRPPAQLTAVKAKQRRGERREERGGPSAKLVLRRSSGAGIVLSNNTARFWREIQNSKHNKTVETRIYELCIV